MKNKINQKGLTPLIIIAIIALAVFSILAVDKIKGIKLFGYKTEIEPSSAPVVATSSAQATPAFSAFVKPSFLPNVSTSPSVSPSPQNSPTSTPQATSEPTEEPCNYDLSSSTGAIQVNIKPKTDMVVGDQIVELQAKSNCKVLDGKSTDRLTAIAKAGGNGYSSSNSVNFSTVPPGNYSVRIQYKGAWTDYKGVNVVSAQLVTSEFEVEGSSAPTPSSKPKPACSIVILPSSTGTAPYQASICVSNDSNPSQQLSQEYSDFDGDGTWDYSGQDFGCHQYTFQNTGTFTPKAKIVHTEGLESDICQTTATIN